MRSHACGTLMESASPLLDSGRMPRWRGRATPGPAWCGLMAVAAVGPLIYPAWLIAKYGRSRPHVPPRPAAWPPISVIVAAYREAAVIDAKIGDLRRNEYPGSLEIIVVADDEQTARAAEAGG